MRLALETNAVKARVPYTLHLIGTVVVKLYISSHSKVHFTYKWLEVMFLASFSVSA